MITPSSRVLLTFLVLCLAACSPQVGEMPKPPELEQRADNLYYLKDQKTTFTGEFVKTAKNGVKQELATYLDGKLHGPTLSFIREKIIKRRTDYVDGQRVRKRVWYDNGQLKADETWADTYAYGPCSYWFADGRLRKTMCMAKDYEPNGHVLEYDESGEVLIDVILDRGKLISGKWKPGAEKLLRLRYSQDQPAEEVKKEPQPKVASQT